MTLPRAHALAGRTHAVGTDQVTAGPNGSGNNARR